MTKEDLIKRYLGKKYKHLGRVPSEGLDCWGLIKCVYEDAGIKVFDLESYDENWSRKGENYFVQHYCDLWKKVDVPHFMDVVLFKHNEIANHAGIILDKFHFIHASRAGVVINRIMEMRWALKIEGFYRYSHDKN